MTKLQDILYKVHLKEVHGSTDLDVLDIQIDSRKLSKGSVFVAIKGEKTDGHKFFNKAVELGASVIICESLPKQFVDGITYIQVNSTNEAVAYMAHNFLNTKQLIDITFPWKKGLPINDLPHNAAYRPQVHGFMISNVVY